MNHYQKTGVFVLRIIGAIAVLGGIIGPVYILAGMAAGQRMPEYSADRWTGSIVWAVGGLALFLGAKPIGRLMGRGLD